MSSQLDTKKAPRAQQLDHDVAMRLAATEYDKVAGLLARLTPEQWKTQTDCPGWDVRAMAGHMLGMAQMAASLPEMMRQQRAAAKIGGVPIDALTAHQVDKNAHLSTDELVSQMRTIGPKAARSRRRMPGFLRGRRFPEVQTVGGHDEWWTLGFLTDTILTRDPFLHRIDIGQAIGVPLEPTPEHEGVLVDDIVREWAGRHGQPYRLELSGPAGGTWDEAAGGERITMDALEFLRALSGRAPAAGLLETQVPV